MEQKEYFFILTLRDRTKLTFWDLAKDDAEAQKMQLKLHNHFDAIMSWNTSPNDYKCTAAFLNVMRSAGFNGSWQLSPI